MLWRRINRQTVNAKFGFHSFLLNFSKCDTKRAVVPGQFHQGHKVMMYLSSLLCVYLHFPSLYISVGFSHIILWRHAESTQKPRPWNPLAKHITSPSHFIVFPSLKWRYSCQWREKLSPEIPLIYWVGVGLSSIRLKWTIRFSLWVNVVLSSKPSQSGTCDCTE